MKLITKAQAKKQGLKHYYTGRPCPRGHIAKRFTSIGTCSECAREKAMERHVHTTDKRRHYSDLPSFIEAATSVHSSFYTYPNAVYGGAHTPLEIECPEHGPFYQNPSNHVIGKKGCPQCGLVRRGLKSRSSIENFVSQAEALWGKKYDYSKVNYVRAHVKVKIICPEHGPFEQTPTNHLGGKGGCSKCNHMKSAGEQEVLKFLSVFDETQHRVNGFFENSSREIDIYLPNQNLAVEYCGDYHHAHRDKDHEKKFKNKHWEKYRDCKQQGVRLITLYESEWKNRKVQVKRLLRSAIGKLRGRVFARKCEVKQVPIKEARAFFEKYHVQGGSGSGQHYGLYWSGKLVACMRFTLGGNDRGKAAKNRSWTLSRYATRISVVGGASRLFKAFLNDQGEVEVKSFSDNRLFLGGMYQKLGFKLQDELPPDYQVWSNKIGLRPKSHYQRRMIPKRLWEHGVEDSFDPATDPRTEADMTYLMGCRRLYDCGKLRWVYTPKV